MFSFVLVAALASWRALEEEVGEEEAVGVAVVEELGQEQEALEEEVREEEAVGVAVVEELGQEQEKEQVQELGRKEKVVRATEGGGTREVREEVGDRPSVLTARRLQGRESGKSQEKK